LKPIYLVVLAAGLSTRFGRNKLVEPVDGIPMVARVVKAGQDAGLKNTVVVTGHDRDKVLAALSSFKLEEVFNEEYVKGMSTSIRAGVAHVREKARAVAITPGDMAFITPRLFQVVLDEYSRARNHIIVATYKGRSGHPILFDSHTFADLLSISETKRGMKEVVQKFRESTTYVDTSTPRALLDIDYETDFRRASRELKGEGMRGAAKSRNP
jgi:molybdenum cofactor cytidylyltransferase